MLQQIGAALDEFRPLRVHVRGLVALNSESQPVTSAKEFRNERQKKTRSSARSRERAARRQGPTGGSWSARPPPRVGGDMLRTAYEGQLKCVAEAYPSLRIFPDNDGMWLLAKSSVIPSLQREATFLVALPYRPGIGPRTWGFWADAGSYGWIGPRHTNFQDGSVCAFSPTDRVWFDGDDLRTLLDLYSVWAARHLHLEVFGRWPGKQYGLNDADPRVQAYYRLRECKDHELCGCGSETRRYAECCKPSDQQLDIIVGASLFLRHVPGGFSTRRPPQSVVEFVEGRSEIPRMADVHPTLAHVIF
ncbi:hypothetical protein ACVII1_006292 [Bradyrhizobium elkanii]